MKPQDLTTSDILRFIQRDRQRARTDLLFLCHHILGYKDVDAEVHKPILLNMPNFAGGRDVFENRWVYTPAVELWRLPGSRKRLDLYPRGSLKTSIITIAGTIQWILNYPDVRVLLTSATADLVQKILLEMKAHFQFNPNMRYFFPEFCPPDKKAADFGNQDAFIVPARRKISKEPTVSVSSVGKVIAGSHYEVLVCSDMVDKENIKTLGAIREVIDHFNYMNPLLERSEIPPHHGWIIVEGTRYAHRDLYGKIIKDNELSQDWSVLCGDAEVDQTKKLTYWPARFPWDELKRIETAMSPSLYSAQFRNHPIADSGGLATEDQLAWFDDKARRAMESSLRKHTTIDVAGMETDSQGDYTVITTCGFDKDGRCYVLDMRRGRFSPTEVIWHIFDVWTTHKPADIKVEKDAHARVLGHFLRREMEKKQQFPLIVDLQRDTRTSKLQRIRGLQPWFQAKIIRFYEGLQYKTDLIQEIVEFPSSAHDDILDTLADQMQNREGGVNTDVIPDAPYEIPWGQEHPPNKFLGFDEMTHQPRWSWDEQRPSGRHAMTGL